MEINIEDLKQYKHYITTDSDGYITKVFCDAFESANETDILLRETNFRLFYLFDPFESYSLYEKNGQPKYKYVNGEVIESVKPLTNEQKLIPIKLHRNELLKASDFMVLADAPYTAEQLILIKEYRQALRDLPETVDLDNPTYPVKPI
jgi:hypothetical protein